VRKGLSIALLFFCFILSSSLHAQEFTGPLRYNPVVNKANAARHSNPIAKKTTTTLTLPFFEDFTGTYIFPDTNKWVENEVYINNTMCASPVSRGVATFDALDRTGLPYDTLSNGDFRFADSLTSQPIDLSGYTPGDSLYLSFFYQPQGNGFYPLPGDSLILFVKIVYGDWEPVWRMPGSRLQPFKQVMIPITDSLDFHNAFQFRFVNIAALNYADAIWNVDYVRLNSNRNMYDTLVNDIAFSTDPSFLLNDYSFMPYRQFMAFPGGERAGEYTDSIHNNYPVDQAITYGFTARETTTNTPLYTAPTGTTTLTANTVQQLTYPSYTATIPLGGAYDKVIFENKSFIQHISATDTIPNDTIVREQIFDNYLAYDDGTAEQAYYLNLFPTLPGKIAIEYHLNRPDTMRGMAIYFGRQVPLAYPKYFSIAVYHSLAGVDGAFADSIIYQQDLYNPGYMDTINHFWIYSFITPVALPASTFYAGTLQPALSGSDSLYIGLDVNRIGGNHTYFSVLDSWNPSLVSGALMMRPLLGQAVISTSVNDVKVSKDEWSVSPNPAHDKLKFNTGGKKTNDYRITDMKGLVVNAGNMPQDNTVNIAQLPSGVYLVNIVCDGITSTTKKIVKE